MKLRDHLVTMLGAFAAASGLSEARQATLIFNDGKTAVRLRAGGDVATGTYERAMQWFSDHWPDGADWPAAVPRPIPSAPHPVDAAPAAALSPHPGAAAGTASEAVA